MTDETIPTRYELLRCDGPSRGDRLYDFPTLNRLANEINNGQVICIMDASTTLSVDMSRVVGYVKNAVVEHGALTVELAIADTPCGVIMQTLIDEQLDFDICTAGSGNVSREGLVTDFVLAYCFTTAKALPDPHHELLIIPEKKPRPPIDWSLPIEVWTGHGLSRETRIVIGPDKDGDYRVDFKHGNGETGLWWFDECGDPLSKANPKAYVQNTKEARQAARQETKKIKAKLKPRGRYLCLFHRMVQNDLRNIPLDKWMDDNIPDEFRVVAVTKETEVDVRQNLITHHFTVTCERKETT